MGIEIDNMYLKTKAHLNVELLNLAGKYDLELDRSVKEAQLRVNEGYANLTFDKAIGRDKIGVIQNEEQKPAVNKTWKEKALSFIKPPSLSWRPRKVAVGKTLGWVGVGALALGFVALTREPSPSFSSEPKEGEGVDCEPDGFVVNARNLGHTKVGDGFEQTGVRPSEICLPPDHNLGQDAQLIIRPTPFSLPNIMEPPKVELVATPKPVLQVSPTPTLAPTITTSEAVVIEPTKVAPITSLSVIEPSRAQIPKIEVPKAPVAVQQSPSEQGIQRLAQTKFKINRTGETFWSGFLQQVPSEILNPEWDGKEATKREYLVHKAIILARENYKNGKTSFNPDLVHIGDEIDIQKFLTKEQIEELMAHAKAKTVADVMRLEEEKALQKA